MVALLASLWPLTDSGLSILIVSLVFEAGFMVGWYVKAHLWGRYGLRRDNEDGRTERSPESNRTAG